MNRHGANEMAVREELMDWASTAAPGERKKVLVAADYGSPMGRSVTKLGIDLYKAGAIHLETSDEAIRWVKA